MSATRTEIHVGERALSVSNLEKILYPRDGYTKGDVIAYYRGVSSWILPHLTDRPLTLQRYPDGIDGPSFFEKHLPKALPDWVAREAITSPGGQREKTTYMICNDEPALVYVANLASLVLHVWTSRVATIEEPEYVFFDLDPGERCTLKTLATVALQMRDALEAIGMTSLVKTSGGLGLHVVVPLASGYSYEAAKIFAEALAHRLVNIDPKGVTLDRALRTRDQSAVYLDYVQVGRGKTIVAPYSLRARDGAPVSTPLEWAEVEAYARKRTAEPWQAFAQFNIITTPQRVKKRGDLWGVKYWKKQRLEPAIGKAQKQWSA